MKRPANPNLGSTLPMFKCRSGLLGLPLQKTKTQQTQAEAVSSQVLAGFIASTCLIHTAAFLKADIGLPIGKQSKELGVILQYLRTLFISNLKPVFTESRVKVVASHCVIKQ